MSRVSCEVIVACGSFLVVLISRSAQLYVSLSFSYVHYLQLWLTLFQLFHDIPDHSMLFLGEDVVSRLFAIAALLAEVWK